MAIGYGARKQVFGAALDKNVQSFKDTSQLLLRPIIFRSRVRISAGRTQGGLEFSFVLVGERSLQDPAARSLQLFEDLVGRGFSH